MSRTNKPGLKYFTHDVDMREDIKIRRFKVKHGLEGYAIFIILLEEIYRTNGYYIVINDDFKIIFCDDYNIDEKHFDVLLQESIACGLFDAESYNKSNILTSKRIQKNYCDGTQRRKEIMFLEEYLLIDAKKHYREKVDVMIMKNASD